LIVNNFASIVSVVGNFSLLTPIIDLNIVPAMKQVTASNTALMSNDVIILNGCFYWIIIDLTLSTRYDVHMPRGVNGGDSRPKVLH
jgi:hypothetical protein